MKKIIYLFFTLCICIVLGLGLILLSELIFRKIHIEPVSGYLIDAVLFPYAEYLVSTQPPNVVGGPSKSWLDNYFTHSECDEEGGIMFRCNSNGFRSPEFNDLPSKKTNEFRIIIIGGSVSISWNVGEKCTLDRQLHKALSALHPDLDIKIFNLGSAAWISFQELICLQLYGLNIQPDLVIAFDGFNDIEHAFHMPINASYSNGQIVTAFQHHKKWLASGAFDLFEEFKILHFFKNIRERRSIGSQNILPSQLPDVAQKPEPGKLGTRVHKLPVNLEEIRTRTDFDPYNQLAVDNYLKNITLMARSLSSINSTLLVALQPALFLKHPLSASEEKNFWKYYEGETNFVVLGYLRMIDGLNKLATENQNINFLDLSAPFTGDKRTLLTDYAHTNKIGYGIIAQNLAQEISRLIKNKRIKITSHKPLP